MTYNTYDRTSTSMKLSSLLRLDALARKLVSMCAVQEIWRPSVPVLREDSPYAAFGVRDHAVGQPDQLQRRGCRDSTQDKRELEGTWI